MNSLVLVGISHKTAPVEWREKLAVPDNRLPALMREFSRANLMSEAVVLSTCNRVEIYAVTASPEKTISFVQNALTALHGAPPPESFYKISDEEAVRHLFRVSAGLDSLVIGETEILGQVKRAYESAKSAEFTGKLANVLFQRAIYVGKMIRTDTRIAEGPTSTASLAVGLAEKIFGDLRHSRVLVAGAGSMAELAARCFKSQKVARLSIVNRTFEKAKDLAAQFGGQAYPFADIIREVEMADIVLCSTGSPAYILRRGDVADVMRRRNGKSLFLIDIAVPRDVDPEVHQLDNVYLYNIDDLETLVAESLLRRRAEIEKAGALVDGKAQEFLPWYDAWRQGEAAALRHRSRAASPSFQRQSP